MSKTNTYRFLAFALFALCLMSFEQDKSVFTLNKSFPFKADKMLADHIGNYYLVSDYKVQKVNRFDSLLQFHQRKNLGKIGRVDVSNPMKILVYFPDFRSIDILDNNMTELRVLKLDEYGDMQVNAVCASNTNGIWIYDENTAILKRINESRRNHKQSVSTRQSMNKVLHVSSMLERNGYVYLCDENEGIAVFDLFGSFSKLIPIKGIQSFNVVQDQLIFMQNKTLVNYNLQSLSAKEMQLPNPNAKDVCLFNNKLVSLAGDSVSIFNF